MGIFGRAKRRVDAVESRVNERLPSSLKVGFLTLYLHTDRGNALVDAIAARGPWRRWHDVGVAVLALVMASGLGAIGWVAVAVATRDVQATAANQANNVLAIPGVNDFMPVAATGYVVLALLVATVVHEGGHAIGFRTEGVDLDELGVALLFGVLPIAAYAKPATDLDGVSPRGRLRVFAAGVANNVAVTALVGVGFLVVGVDAIAEAYLTYFGWLYTTAAAPTAADVASLGVAANALFWTGFLNANLAVLNALPIWPFDGGQVGRVVVEGAADALGVDDLRAVWVGASALTASVVAFVVVGPVLL
ncbi:site-2 protease family protein [Halorubellus sp. PRR65]|uniref:site-2 protease family protein n=1 Tax=Halorubellus sp. PRR65 TaxID=3098148 RepID=UPI002B260469|nr:site-2 protease family protein [Halorubellus sp. PRR65]